MILHAFFYLRTIPHTERFTHNQTEFFLSTCARLSLQFHLMRIYRNDLVLLQQTSFILFCSLLFSSRFSLFLVCVYVFFCIFSVSSPSSSFFYFDWFWFCFDWYVSIPYFVFQRETIELFYSVFHKTL